ncbi:MAG: biosynthetic-type acetolactate synthase large subunit [Oscillospiraceae bacterium]|nr:biosynthetic-type acetolactate synthase large subunit [Oscillospiraceae bacterium]
MKLTGADIIVEVLLEQGVDTIFGYPGGTVLNTYDSLYKYSDKINHIMTAHEQGASHAADGYARATGKTGVVLATSGPGATNLVTGIATAYMDSVPMVALTGNVGTSLIGRDSFQEVYIAGITMPITKHNFVVRKVEDLADTIRQAFRIAQEGRKGPVLVDIPKDITAAECEFTPQPVAPLSAPPAPKQESLEQAAKMLNECERPVIMFGGGVVSSEASDILHELMEKADIPACHTLMGAGVVDYRSPLNVGMLGMHGYVIANKAVNEADVVFAVGTRFSDRVALNPNKFAHRAKIIQLDIDPSEINKNVHIDCSVVGDVKDVLQKLLPMINSTKRPEWINAIQGWKASDYRPKDVEGKLRPHQIMNIINQNVGDDAVFVTDVGQHQMWAAQFCKRTKARSFLTSGGLGTMGFGYGAALGAKVAVGDRTVVHITGDGSFHMNLHEGCTAVSYDLPVITVIMNNTVLGMVRQWQTSFYGKRYSSTSPERKTDFVKLAEGFGLAGYRAETPEEFEKAFKQALASGKPAWIDCRIDKDERVLPMIPAGGSFDDIITE